VGALLMNGSPATNEWYQQLDKAPWTPPGWFFGLAWTTIMICYSIYMNQLWKTAENKKQLLFLYGIQWLLNVGWNPVFFHFHWMGLGMVVILFLEITLIIKHLKYFNRSILSHSLIAPYIIWLAIAFSLNAYAWWNA
jgi:benzodiazapine receptor